MTHWQHGMIVRCVRADWNHLPFGSDDVPIVGRLYTIEDILIEPQIAGKIGLGFSEEDVASDWWSALNFEPVDEAALDELRAILDEAFAPVAMFVSRPSES